MKEDGRTDVAAGEEEQQGSDWLVLTFSDPAELQLEGFVLHLVMNDVDAAVTYRQLLEVQSLRRTLIYCINTKTNGLMG